MNNTSDNTSVYIVHTAEGHDWIEVDAISVKVRWCRVKKIQPWCGRIRGMNKLKAEFVRRNEAAN